MDEHTAPVCAHADGLRATEVTINGLRNVDIVLPHYTGDPDMPCLCVLVPEDAPSSDPSTWPTEPPTEPDRWYWFAEIVGGGIAPAEPVFLDAHGQLHLLGRPNPHGYAPRTFKGHWRPGALTCGGAEAST